MIMISVSGFVRWCALDSVLPGFKLVVVSELKEFRPIVVQWGTISSYRSGLGVTTGKRREEVSVDAFTASVTSELVRSFHEGKHASSVFISWPDWLFDSDIQTARPIARQVLLTFIFQVPALSRSPTVISQMVLCNETSGAVFFQNSTKFASQIGPTQLLSVWCVQWHDTASVSHLRSLSIF